MYIRIASVQLQGLHNVCNNMVVTLYDEIVITHVALEGIIVVM